MRNAEFNLPILAELYDAECPWSRDDDFFLSVVNQASGARVLDLGCGTGRLSLGMSAAGHTVTGVDPAGASLDRARTKPGAHAVTWLHGTSEILPSNAFDIAVMTSHVAQFFVTDAEWQANFTDLHRALAPGGRLVFDTRDPRARAWERWNPIDSARDVFLPDGRRCHAWTEVTAVEGEPAPVVHFTHHYELPGLAELTSEASLRFRGQDEVRTSLNRLGFSIENVYGGWSREPVGHSDGELLVIATRNPA
ncbi:MAG TPA: class I SAM-dependent methyltransferase [Kribbella sp.]|nr:class I SAM-dependent methyltransferase [Kribbella sp.]